MDRARKTITFDVIRQTGSGDRPAALEDSEGLTGFHNRGSTGRTGDNRTQPAEALVSS